jgi:phosphinothricin acetyltransferase
MTIRLAHSSDATSIDEIYNYYIANTAVTFEENPISALDIETRIEETKAKGLPWLVAEDDRGNSAEVIGYAYASKWKGRCPYRHSVEVTVYLSHAAIGGISLPNEASVALHEKLGIKKSPTLKK